VAHLRDLLARARAGAARWGDAVRVCAVAVAGAALGWNLVFGSEGYIARRGLLAEIDRREREIAALTARIAATREEIRSLRDDPAATERAIRAHLGLVLPGETVYRIESTPPR
jgi:cell division protein FtsB